MALFIRQNEDRSKLQERLAAELQEKQKRQHEIDNPPLDRPEDTSYMQHTKKSSMLLPIWIILAIAAIGIVIAIAVMGIG